jgi:hypothetical protein
MPMNSLKNYKKGILTMAKNKPLFVVAQPWDAYSVETVMVFDTREKAEKVVKYLESKEERSHIFEVYINEIKIEE